VISAKYCIFEPLNFYLLKPKFCYFLMFLLNFGVLVFYRLLRYICG
jgi:hypothetical protein